MNFARLKILLGVLCLLALTYWVLALHFTLAGSDALHRAYEATYRNGRRGSMPMWFLSLGGLVLIGSGLRDLGIVRDDPT